MIGYVKHFDRTKKMSFKVSDNKLFKKVHQNMGKNMNIRFNSEPAYVDNDTYLKTKIKLYGDKINTNFQGKKILKENTSYKCISLIIKTLENF